MPGKPLTWRGLYTQICMRLGSRFEAGQLLAHVAKTPPAQLFTADAPVAEEDILRLDALCDRRAAGEPLQYLLGEWEFYSLPFYVGEGVLIPRQDTETLVDAALERIGGRTGLQVLDLCAGSGCVAVAAAHHSKGRSQFTALELSDAAFAYLVRNIARNGAPVAAVQGDVFVYTHPQPLDLITANPPYIPRAELDTLQREVRCEPRRALDGGEDGLDFYRGIAARYLAQLAPGGWLLCEVGAGQAGAVCELFRDAGYAGVDARADLAGIPRVVQARRPHSDDNTPSNREEMRP